MPKIGCARREKRGGGQEGKECSIDYLPHTHQSQKSGKISQAKMRLMLQVCLILTCHAANALGSNCKHVAPLKYYMCESEPATIPSLFIENIRVQACVKNITALKEKAQKSNPYIKNIDAKQCPKGEIKMCRHRNYLAT